MVEGRMAREGKMGRIKSFGKEIFP